MRKITSESAYAFEHKQWYRGSNTKVFIDSAGSWLELHGNRIANINEGGELEITSAGWPTATTKERLNGLVGVHIIQKAGQWYLNGREWNGEWVCVSRWDELTKPCGIIECKKMVDSSKTKYCSKHLI